MDFPSVFSLAVYFYSLLLPSSVRHLEPDPGLIYAPADGKVVVIEETVENEYFRDKRLQISIFMSPFNMHSNRYPVSGQVKYVNYHSGNYMVAWHPKSSELNERSTIVIETEKGTEILLSPDCRCRCPEDSHLCKGRPEGNTGR